LDLRRQALLRRLYIRKVQLGSVDTRDDRGARRHRRRHRGGRVRLRRRPVGGQQDTTAGDHSSETGGTNQAKRSYRETRMHRSTYNEDQPLRSGSRVDG